MSAPCKLRPAYPSDLPAVKTLWQAIFGDTPESVEAFFRAFPKCRAVVAEAEDGTLVSMVNVLTQTLAYPGGTLPVAYLYAIGTREDYRGRRLGQTLTGYAEALLARLGYALTALTPAAPSLFRYYAQQGYIPAFFRSRTAFSGGREVDAAAYLERREAILEKVPHIRYDAATLAYVQAVYGLRFYETDTGIAAAGDSYTGEVLPEDLGGTPFAMAKWLCTPRPMEPGYLGFAME